MPIPDQTISLVRRGGCVAVSTSAIWPPRCLFSAALLPPRSARNNKTQANALLAAEARRHLIECVERQLDRAKAEGGRKCWFGCETRRVVHARGRGAKHSDGGRAWGKEEKQQLAPLRKRREERIRSIEVWLVATKRRRRRRQDDIRAMQKVSSRQQGHHRRDRGAESKAGCDRTAAIP